MSKITVTVSGPVGAGKTTLCAKLEILLKHLGCDVTWKDGAQEENLGIEEWPDKFDTKIELVERVVGFRKVYETFSGQNGWVEVSQEEYDRTKHNYSHRIRRVPVDEVADKGDAVCVDADGCPTERAVLQRFWRAHAGRMPQLIEQPLIDELITKHSEWTPHGLAVVDSHRQKLVDDLLVLMRTKVAPKKDFVQAQEVCGGRKDFVFAHMEGWEPTGYLMKHLTGPDRGFSWNKNSPDFSEEWERIGLYTEEQLAAALTSADDGYQARAKRWRDSFDTMHRRAMNAEAKALTQGQIDAIKFAIGYLGNGELNQEMVAVLKTITENE
jgi:hypothetical protein